MAGTLEQLRYTWAPRGVEGVNRFQVAAMSPGFKGGEVAAVLSKARALCRYDPPRSDERRRPVSFGWIDHDRYRIAFQRIALPDSTDRAGNFAAHLLVGRPDALPEAGVASSFGSPLWWRGITAEERSAIAEGKRDFELPTAGLEEFIETAPDPDCSEEASMAVLHALLRLPPGDQLAVSAEGEALAQTLSTVARLLPEALTGLTTSTYEGKAVHPFRLLGTSAPAPRMHTCDLRLPESLGKEERRSLEMLTGAGSASDEFRGVVGRAGHGAGAEAAARMWETALLLVGLECGRETDARPDDSLLADSELTGFLARSPEGRTVLARWVQMGGVAVLRGMKAAGERMGSTCRDALYAAMGERYSNAGDLRGSAAAVEVMAPGPAKQRVLDQLVEAAGVETTAATLGPEDAGLVIARAAEQGLDPTKIRPLLRGSVRHIAHCAAEPSIPDSYLAAMFEIALGKPDLSTLSEAIRSRPTFLESVSLDGAEADRCVDLLGRFDRRTRKTALRPLLPLLLASSAASRVPPVVTGLPPEACAQMILTASSEGLPSSEEVDRICDPIGAILLDRKRSDLACRLLAESRSEDGVLATALLRRLEDGRGGGAAAIAVETGGIRSPELRRALRRLAFDQARCGATSLGAVEAMWNALGQIFPREDDDLRLRRILGAGKPPPPPEAGVEILAWVAGSLLDRRSNLVGRLGALKDRETEAAAAELAKIVQPWRFTEATPFVENASRRARKWWSRLEGQAKKSERQNR